MNVTRRTAARAGPLAAAAVVAAAMFLAPVAPAQAQAGCLTADHHANHWSAGPDTGGFTASVTLANGCAAPVDGWTLELALPAGHALSHGWSADWSASGVQVTASHLDWNAVIGPDQSITVGFAGSWTGAYQDPVSCMVNGGECDGDDPGDNQPPEVVMTRPDSDTVVRLAPCPVTFGADAGDPDGDIDRVEFYVNDGLVGTDDTAPYRVDSSFGAFPPPSGTFGYTALARAYDGGMPPRSTDSEPVEFSVAVADPVPESLLACLSSLEVAAGSTEEIRFGLYSATADEVTLTVTGDPGVTVSPTTVVADGSLVLATVSAAAGSTGATATITASAEDVSPATMSITVS